MPKIRNLAELESIRCQAQHSLSMQQKKVLVCCGTGCIAGGSLLIYDRIKETCRARGIDVCVELKHEPHGENIGLKASGCHGFCEMGPLLKIEPLGVLYIKVKLSDCDEIIERSIIGDEVIERLLYTQNGKAYQHQEEIPFYHKQTRIVLSNCGQTNAEDVLEYIAKGGYSALSKVLFEMNPESVCQTILESNLRGRGGGGFPAGRKWDQVRRQPEPVHYVVCNGDEGDPGAFMDRSIMEGDPHKMLEGMMIAGYAAGAREGFIYVRAEYPLAIRRLQTAIAKAEEWGLLGENILGSKFSFTLHINRGAGAFVCGEGSALTASIEGSRGMPRVKPPRHRRAGVIRQTHRPQ